MSKDSLFPTDRLLCNCGKPVRYSHGDRHSCNKYCVCPTYEELRSSLEVTKDQLRKVRERYASLKRVFRDALSPDPIDL
jgi:hypothetical protein